jgi:hypothetical protein
MWKVKQQPERQRTMADEKEHAKGGLEPAPATPTHEKSEPEAGTGSADKRSQESQAEQAGTSSDGDNSPGEAGGDITR